MAYKTVRLIKCCRCYRTFSARDKGRVVKGYAKVISALAKQEQECPGCNTTYAKGTLLKVGEKQWLKEKVAKERRPKRVVKCSVCKETGHNRKTCPEDEYEGVEDDDLMPDYDE